MITYVIDIDEGEVPIKIDLDTGVEASSTNSVEINESISGAEGRSAYASALRNGYIGSEQQWLASLKGQPGDSVVEDPGDLTITLRNAMI